MPDPTFLDVQNKTADNKTLNYSIPRYGENYIKRSPKTITFTLTGLDAGRDYEIFMYIMNINQVHNPTLVTRSFSTKSNDLIILQNYLILNF